MTNMYQVVDRYLYANLSASTHRMYESNLRSFRNAGFILPCTTLDLVTYFANKVNTLNVRTLYKHMISIRQWHVNNNYTDPTLDPVVKSTLRGMTRVHGKPLRKAASIANKEVDILSKSVNLRDASLLQIGFYGALRRSEISALTWSDVQFEAEGLLITIPRSKVDQDHKGAVVRIPGPVNIPYTPAWYLNQWKNQLIKANKYTNSLPIFVSINRFGKIGSKSLSGVSINKIIKRIFNTEKVSGHSLRRGFATSASQSGASLASIMQQGRWKLVSTVMGYVDESKDFKHNAVTHMIQSIY